MTGSITKRGNAWRIRISLGRDSVTGKRNYHTTTVRGTKKEAEKVMRDLIRQFEMGTLVERTTMSLNEYLEKWLETSAKIRVRERTLVDYRQCLRRYVTDTIGRLPLDRITTLVIQGLYTDLQARGLSRTIKLLHAILGQALKRAVLWGMLPRNPATDVELPRNVKQKREMRAMEPDQAMAFRRALVGHKHRVLFEVALASGMRPGEYTGLQWPDVDYEACGLRVERALVRPAGREWRFEEPKTPTSRRFITMPEQVMAMLRRHELVVHGLRHEFREDHDLVFPGLYGQPLDSHLLSRRAFKPILRQAGLPTSFRLYDLRHTACTLLLLAGVPVGTVSKRLGHASATMTLNIYGHVLPSMEKDAADKMTELLYSSPLEPDTREKGGAESDHIDVGHGENGRG